MYNKTIIEGKILDVEYITGDDNTVVVNGTILSSNEHSKCVLYFYIQGNLAKKYHKNLFKDTKILLNGKLELKQWNESNGNKKSRYILNVEKLKLVDEIDNKKFTILYSSENNSFIL